MGGDGGWVCTGKERKRMDPWCGETVGQDSLAGQLQEIEANKESRETFRYYGLRQEKLWEFIMESIEHPVGSYIKKSGLWCLGRERLVLAAGRDQWYPERVAYFKNAIQKEYRHLKGVFIQYIKKIYHLAEIITIGLSRLYLLS